MRNDTQSRSSSGKNRLVLRLVCALGAGAGCIGLAWSVSGAPEKVGPAAAVRLSDKQSGKADETSHQPSVLQTEQIILVDRQGRKCMQFSGEDAGPSIVLFDCAGKKRLKMSVEGDAPAIAVFDGRENTLATLQVVGDQASLRLGSRQPDRESVISLEAGPQSNPGLYVRDDSGKRVASLTRERAKEGHLLLESGKRGTSVKSDGLFVRDEEERSRATVALLNGNFPVVGLSSAGQEGPPSVEITAGDGGSRALALHNRQGFALFSVNISERDAACLQMQHPDDNRLLEVSLGSKDEDGPVMAFTSPEDPEHPHNLLTRLVLGLAPDFKPYLRMYNSQGSPPIFAAPKDPGN